MHRRNILFDLDGTILDAKPRLFRLFTDLVPESAFSYEEYWALKMKKTNHAVILKKYFNYSDTSVDEFQARWMKNIETPFYLDLDTPFRGASTVLSSLRAENRLFIVSHRQSYASATYQLRKWKLYDYFDEILITEQLVSKTDLIRKNIAPLDASDIMIGDTGEDIQTAKSLDIIAVAVLSGFLGEAELKAYQPDYLFDTIAGIKFEVISKAAGKL